MFRGGPVDSRGTGITSGLMDGGRVGYNQGKLVLGGDLYSKEDFSKFIQGYRPNMSPALINNLFDRKTGELKPGMTYENIFEAKDEEDKPISVFDADIFDFSKVGIKGDKANRLGAKMTGKDDFADALKTDVLDKLKEVVSHERMREEITKMMKHDTIKSLELLSKITGLMEIVFSNGMWLMPTTKK